jgi:uncharacterized membrane protein YdjX (TVP38/TMEM64 family)
MKKYVFRFLLLSLVIFLIIAIANIGLSSYFNIEDLGRGSQLVANYVNDNYWLSLLIFVGIFALITTIFSPSVVFLVVAGGYLFGTWPGAISSNIGATFGSFLAFLIARYLFGGYIHKHLAKRLKSFESNLKRNGVNYLLFLRLVPLIPTFLINIFSGVTKINKRTFLWTTAAGNFPADLVYSFAGSQLREVSSLDKILSTNMILALIAIGCASLIPIFLRRHPEKYLS